MPANVAVIHSDTALVEEWLGRLRDGDECARDVLIEHSCERLRLLVRQTMKNERRVREQEATDDVLQVVLIKLHRALKDVPPASPAEYASIAATQIRRHLIDLGRKHRGPQSYAANHRGGDGVNQQAVQPNSDNAWTVDDWTAFHKTVDLLSPEHRAVFDLLWYEGYDQDQAAECLGVSRQTINRRWRAARIDLRRLFDGDEPCDQRGD